MSEKATRIILLVAYSIFSLLPIYWVTSLSLQQKISFPPKIVPTNPTISHYTGLITEPGILISILNSVFVGLSVGFISVLISSMAGYAFSKLEFRGKRVIFLGVILTFLLPPQLNIVPLYSLFAEMSLLNNRLGMIFLYQILVLPLNIFLFINYFDTVKKAIVESAIIDGAGPIRRYYKIFIPLSKPAIIAAFIFGFRFSWAEYVFATTFIRSEPKMLFTAALKRTVFAGQYTINYDYMAAGAILLLIPTLLVLIYGQKYLQIGLQLGGVD